MNDYSFTVDTRPMANSVDSVSSNVSRVTGAVVAMQAAVIAAEQAASKKICDNVDKGFYIMLASQLTQKMAACSSRITSQLAKMQKFRGDITSIKGTMEGDYHRISARYAKLFKNLDKALETRIKELDGPSVKVSEYQKNSMRQVRNDSATTLFFDRDSQILKNSILLAHLKSKSSKTIESLSADVNNNIDRDKMIADMLEDGSLESLKIEYVPVIISETESLVSREAFISKVYAPENGAVAVQEVNSILNNKKLEWVECDSSESDRISQCFIEKCGQDIHDERIRNEVLRLYKESRFKSLGGIE